MKIWSGETASGMPNVMTPLSFLIKESESDDETNPDLLFFVTLLYTHMPIRVNLSLV